MKTIIRISQDLYGNQSFDDFKESISYIVNECISCYCEVKNDSFINTVEASKKYATTKGEFKKKTTVKAIGYSQSDWQEYTIHHNLEDDNKELKRLVSELKKSFTHFNDYIVEKFESEEINGKTFNSEPYDYTNFSIRHTEFPSEKDVLNEYIDLQGEDFDKSILDLN